MTARVFCFVSAKGGAGKTSVAANFAKLVCAVGRRPLLIDCDPATHGLSLLYLHEISEVTNPNAVGLFDIALTDDISTTIRDSLVVVEGGVHLLPATYRFHLPTDESSCDVDHLQTVIRAVKDAYDVIFLDAQAGTDDCARVAMSERISDEAVIVSEYDPLSAAGVEMMKRVVGEDLSYARTSILLNKILPEFVKDFGEFMSVTKYLPPIPWDIDVVRSYAQRKLALDLQQGNAYTLAVIQSARRLLASVCGEDISSWVSKRAYELRAPLEEQLSLAQEQLNYLEFERAKRAHRARRRSLLLTGGVAYGALVSSALVLYYSPFFDTVFEFGIGTFSLAAALGLVALVATSWRLERRREVDDSPYSQNIDELRARCARLEVLRDADDETVLRDYQAADPAPDVPPLDGDLRLKR